MIPLAYLFRRYLKFQVTVSITFSVSRNSTFTSAHRCACVHAKSLQLCSTLWNPMDCSLPGSSVHGILQASTVPRWLLRGIPGHQTLSPALPPRCLAVLASVCPMPPPQLLHGLLASFHLSNFPFSALNPLGTNVWAGVCLPWNMFWA